MHKLNIMMLLVTLFINLLIVMSKDFKLIFKILVLLLYQDYFLYFSEDDFLLSLHILNHPFNTHFYLIHLLVLVSLEIFINYRDHI
jgi:hypothetical protein